MNVPYVIYHFKAYNILYTHNSEDVFLSKYRKPFRLEMRISDLLALDAIQSKAKHQDHNEDYAFIKELINGFGVASIFLPKKQIVSTDLIS